MMEFLDMGEMPAAWIRTFISLVPKKLDSTESTTID